MAFLNVALNYRSSNQQQNIIGISLEAHERLVLSLDEALKKLSLTEEEKTEAFLELTKSKGELDSIAKAVSGFLQAIYREEVPPNQYAATFFRLIGDWQTAGVRIDALMASRNLTPYVAGRRQAAQQAYAAGDIVEAIRLLDESDTAEQDNERRLLEHRKEIEAEIEESRQGRIATKEAQISLALAGSYYANAARLIAERIDLLKDDPEERLAMLQSKFVDFLERGRREGLPRNLNVAIEISRLEAVRARNSDEQRSAADDLELATDAITDALREWRLDRELSR